MKKLVLFNWNIYEYDIVDMGGSVEFTGNVVERRFNSVLEDAIITFDGTQCEARFQRFDFGNADLHCFIYKGIPEDDRDANRESPNSRMFMHAYGEACERSDLFLELQFTRRIKQYGTRFLQLISLFMLISGFVIIFDRHRLIPGLLMILGNIVLITILNSFMKYIRLMRLSEYKPWFFAKEEFRDED